MDHDLSIRFQKLVKYLEKEFGEGIDETGLLFLIGVNELGRGAERFATTNQGGQSSVLRTYKFYDIFPTEIGAIDLSYDDSGIAEFTVTFQVQYFTVGDSLQSNTGATGEVQIS